MLGDLTLDILGTIAKKNGYEPVLLLPKVLKKEPLETDLNLNEFKFKKDDVIGFSCNVANILDSVNLAKILSQISSSTIVFGGPHFDNISSEIILKDNSFIDYILAGSAEKNLDPFLKFLSKGEITVIEGLFYGNNSIQSVKIGKSLTNDELDKLEIPFVERIKSIPIADRKNLTVPVRTSIGCNGFCNFCYRPYKGWIGISSTKVVELFNYYVNEGFRKFLIVDDNFPGTDLVRVNEIAEEFIKIKEKFPDFNFEFDARANSFGDYQKDNFNHLLIDKLIRAGLRNIFVGIESGNTEDLKYFRKFCVTMDPLKQNIYFLKNIKKRSVLLTPGFIMINEESKMERVSKNLDFIDKYLPPQITPEIYCYKISFYSGAELTRRKVKELTIAKDLETVRKIIYGQYKPIFKDKTVSNFSLILDSLRRNFSRLEDELDLSLYQKGNLLKKQGKEFKKIHKKFFEKYIEAAKQNDLSEIDSLMMKHYETVLAIIRKYTFLHQKSMR